MDLSPVRAPMPGLARLLAFLFCLSPVLGQPGCQTQTRYNPIAENYPFNITGVANGTFSLAPISRDLAKSLLPAGFGFVDDIWGGDSFPLLVRAVYVHDIRAPDDMWRNNYAVISLEVPFVDVLRDGATPFRYAHTQLIQVGTPNYAIDIAEQYGVPHIVPSVFDPECDAYQPSQPGSSIAVAMSLRGIPADGSGRAVTVVAPEQLTREGRPFGNDQLEDIINQPRFGVGDGGRTVCGRTRVFFGEEVGFERLVQTKGQVSLSGAFEGLKRLPESGSGWDRVYGIRVGTAFVDDDFVDCKSLAIVR